MPVQACEVSTVSENTLSCMRKYMRTLKPSKWHQPHWFISDAYTNIKSPGNPLFLKGFIRMFFRFRILRYGIIGAIPHFLSKE